KYFSMLIETNKNLNLTAITEEKEVVIKHFLDSVLPYNLFTQNASVVDVGTGAGFPALPLKIVRTDLEVCMVDSLNKRVNFLQDVIDSLQLEKTTAVHARAEDFAQKNREKFDVAVARAVARLDTLVEYLLPLIKVGGIAIIYKSTKLEEELQISQKAISVLGGKFEKIENFTIEEGQLERNILVIKKVSNTPTKYPRPQNKPKLNPIK
ncbi:MAG: 16S rRNA (guanine(527)-N(7))-methyltransferase RsmG, partial [Clostridia bacterium]|nr:16S rRNA (guanine(527)-N(7))-methyltransferase RsmG [Clostridia bacterium]